MKTKVSVSKKIFMMTFILCICLITATLVPFVVNAASFTDTGSHWASEYIDYMVSKKILNGYEDGSFKPDAEVSRAEFIKMLDETFGLTETRSLKFDDVKTSDWYYVYIAKAVAQGYLLDYGSSMDPNAKLTRQETAALIVRYLDLPEDNVVSTSLYSDYSSINTSYRTYVLQASAAGLIKGYPDGTFGPSRTLTRAEALTILYRAAGTIYNNSKTGTDTEANNKNAVIIRSGITISNADIHGDVIITEGASDGTVAFNNCTISGKLIIRGAVKVNLTGSTVSKLTLNILKDYTTEISMYNKTVVTVMTMNTPGKLTIGSGVTVSSLEINEDAVNTEVTGAGTLKNVSIKANGFKSEQMPEKYTLGNSITASFAGSAYNNASATSTGFSSTPTVVSESGSDKLTYTASYSGTIYYYYTNTATAPETSDFMKNYNNATHNGSSSVRASIVGKNNAYSSSVVSSYSYIAIMLKDSDSVIYKPLTIKRSLTTTTNGFTVMPTLSLNSNYDYLSFTSSVSGTVRYYYTTSSVAPDAATFNNNYNIYSTIYKNSVSVQASSAYTNTTYTYTSVSSYTYMAIMLTDNLGTSYQPVVVTRNNANSSAASGFTTTPTLTVGLYDTLTCSPSYSGTLYYYYTNTYSTPTTTNYISNYTNATVKNSLSINANYSSNNLMLSSSVSNYGYLVIMLYNNSTGASYQPIILSRTSNPGIGGSAGFTVNPTITSDGTYDTISFTPSITGKVYCYYSQTASVPTAAGFMDSYNNILSHVKSMFIGNAGTPYSTKFPNAALLSYNYLIIGICDSTNNFYQPMAISRTIGGGSSAGSGFTITPVLSSNYQNDTISFTPSFSGTLYYYYTASPITPTKDTFMSYYYSSPISMKSSFGVTGLISNTQNLAYSSSVTAYSYVVVMLADSSNTQYQPILLTRSGGSGSSGSNAFSIQPTITSNSYNDILNLTPYYSGTLYWYYTNTPSLPSTTDFMMYYNSSSVPSIAKYYAGVTANIAFTNSQVLTSNVSSYQYVVVMLIGTGQTSYQPALVARNSSGGGASGSGFTVLPSITNNGSCDTLTFMSGFSGTLAYYYTVQPTNPTTSFDYYYSQAQVKSQISVAANTQFSSAIQYNTTVSSYNYVVLMITVGTQRYMPIVLPRQLGGGGSGGGNITPTTNGFTVSPTYSSSTTYDMLTFTTVNNGYVYYYYTDSADSVAAIAFKANYDKAKKNGLIIAVGGTLNNGAAMQYKSTVSSYKYIVAAYFDGKNYYIPVIVSRGV